MRDSSAPSGATPVRGSAALTPGIRTQRKHHKQKQQQQASREQTQTSIQHRLDHVHRRATTSSSCGHNCGHHRRATRPPVPPATKTTTISTPRRSFLPLRPHRRATTSSGALTNPPCQMPPARSRRDGRQPAANQSAANSIQRVFLHKQKSSAFVSTPLHLPVVVHVAPPPTPPDDTLTHPGSPLMETPAPDPTPTEPPPTPDPTPTDPPPTPGPPSKSRPPFKAMPAPFKPPRRPPAKNRPQSPPRPSWIPPTALCLLICKATTRHNA